MAIMTIGALVIIIAFCGLALDLSRVYNRKMELQNAADVAALAAARELNGTRAGIDKAIEEASKRFGGSSANSVTFGYGQRMQWAAAAIEFGPTPNGPWQSSVSAQGNPNGLLYARANTTGLDSSYGEVDTVFMPFFSPDLAAVSVSARAIAGRSAIKAMPLGLCAMRPEQRRDRAGELEEYGFRRGVSYDLMQLNPESKNTAQSFLLDPFGASGGGTSASRIRAAEPYVCTGTLAIARLSGDQVGVSSPFPLASLVRHLNSRFASDATACDPETAPPDANVKKYVFNTSVPWMSTAPDGQSAALSEVDSKRWTVAGPDPTPADTTAGMYGPLWAYARAARYASTEPPDGAYATFATSNWGTLYNPGKPTAATSYPSSGTPYMQTRGSANFEAPAGSNKGVRHRRVLNVPLLECPVTGNRATVLGIGRFFMTVPANDTHLYAEFAGLVPEPSLSIQMKLYP
ncbi:pilus assembly protein TadG-related protein [Massilia consociata]|uniref:Pilus assembly protein TadG-related protein n=1 Tax=Massilia consociata TaxID=760117 RepID=A0ABV6FKF9_9BURK